MTNFLQLTDYERTILKNFCELSKQVINNGDREFEIRIRSIDLESGKSYSELDKKYFNDLLGKITGKKILEKSLVFKEHEYSNDRLICTYDSGKFNKIYMTKKTIKSSTIDRLGIKLSIADEIEKELPKNKKYLHIIYRLRTSIINPKISNWRYDFTCIYKYHGVNTDWKNIKEWYSKINSSPEKMNVDRYSVEIEYIGKPEESTNKMINSLIKSLEKLDIHKIIDDYSNICFKNEIYANIKKLIKGKFHLIEPHNILFSKILEQVNTLDHKNYSNIERYPYMLSEKIDGERHLLYIDVNGDFNLLDSRNNCIILCNDKDIANNIAPCVLDCELADVWDKHNLSLQDIIEHIDNILKQGYGNFDISSQKSIITKMLFIIDPLVYNGIDYTKLNFKERCRQLQQIEKDLKNCIECKCKWVFKTKYYFTYTKDNVRKIMNNKHNYFTDGIILSPRNLPYYSNNIYKWKPIELSSIDFLIRIINDNSDEKIIDIYLYVGIRKYNFNKYNLKHSNNFINLFGHKYDDLDYIPVEFQPRDSKNIFKTSFKYIEKNTIPQKINGVIKKVTQYKLKLGEVIIQDNQIVEMIYDNKRKQWAIIRVRYDKTENYYQGKGIGNNWKTAISVWSTIKRPIKLIGGLVVSDDNNLDKIQTAGKYFEKEYKKNGYLKTKIDNLRKFHNYIKMQNYTNYAHNANYILELGGGRANDLYKWGINNIKHVILIDIDKENLIEAEKRFKEYQRKIKNTRKKIKLTLIEGNLETNRIQSLIKNRFFNTKITNLFDAIFANFSISHILKTTNNMRKIINEVYRLLKIDGYFIITSLDGRKVFNKFKELNNTNQLIINNNSIKLIKEYKHSKFMKAGQKIKYYIESIGIEHTEYLVNFEEIIKIATEGEDPKFKIILDKSFKELYEQYINNNGKPLTEGEKEYSFLNRVLILSKLKSKPIIKKSKKKIVERTEDGRTTIYE